MKRKEKKRNEVHTAGIKAIHSKDVIGTHLCSSANGYILIGYGNDGWLPVSWEGKPGVQTHSSKANCDRSPKQLSL